MPIDIESLGFTQEELQQRVIETIADRMLQTLCGDNESENCCAVPSRLDKELRKAVQDRIDRAIAEIADKHIIPNASQYVENICLQETNRWGEKTGKPVTFIEYLVQRAEEYLQEPVDFQGKTKKEAGGYSWAKAQTRLAHMVHEHLHYSIAEAMKSALDTANKSIAQGIYETARVKLNEIASKLRVEVNTK